MYISNRTAIMVAAQPSKSNQNNNKQEHSLTKAMSNHQSYDLSVLFLAIWYLLLLFFSFSVPFFFCIGV